jgi:membrane protein DedA with SNARE-associated domain
VHRRGNALVEPVAVQTFLEWLTGLPAWALYLSVGTVAAIENIFPPIPADTVVAFGSFIAARANDPVAGVWLATLIGNVGSAMALYYVGRRYGAERLEQRLQRKGMHAAEDRLRTLYGRYGLLALFISRFLPGVRAIVPPFAGALRIPAPRVAVVMLAASALWYGVVTYLSYRIGADWETLSRRLGTMQRDAAYVAVLVAAMALLLWVVVRRRRRAAP